MIGAQVFSRRGVEKDERARAIEEQDIERLRKDQEDEIRIIREGALLRVRELLEGKSAANRVGDDRRDETWLNTGDTITGAVLDAIPQRRWKDVQVADAPPRARVAVALPGGYAEPTPGAGEAFVDQLLAGAAMDRLLHHCHVVILEGDSFRNPPRKRGKRATA